MDGMRLAMFPLSTVLFPYGSLSIHVFEPRYRSLVHDCLAHDRRFGVVLIERGSEVGGGDQRAMLGTRGVVVRAGELPDGRWLLALLGETVIRVDEWLPDDPYPLARVSEAASPAPLPGSATKLSELVVAATGRVRRARALLAEQGGAAPLAPGVQLDGGGDAVVAAWQLCGAAPLSAYDAQRLLAAADATERLGRLIELMEELELDLQRMLASD